MKPCVESLITLFLLLSIAVVTTRFVQTTGGQGNQSSPAGGLVVDSNWVAQFIDVVNQYRSSEGAPPLLPCPWLNDFAKARFAHMAMNPAISHYGYYDDFQKYLAQYWGLMTLIMGEEVLYPSGRVPDQYVRELMRNATAHWELLTSPQYAYYGYYIGYAPSYALAGPCQVGEVPSPYVNVTQFFKSHGCNVELKGAAWLVLELSNWCDGVVSKRLLAASFTSAPQSYELVPIKYDLPATGRNATLEVSVASTGPVRLFVLTSDQYERFQELGLEQIWAFTGPAYFYGGESAEFRVRVELSVDQLGEGYYLIISNVLPGANAVDVEANATLIFAPQEPQIQPTT